MYDISPVVVVDHHNHITELALNCIRFGEDASVLRTSLVVSSFICTKLRPRSLVDFRKRVVFWSNFYSSSVVGLFPGATSWTGEYISR